VYLEVLYFNSTFIKTINVGTLLKPDERNGVQVTEREVKLFIENAKELSTKLKVSLAEVLKVYEIKEMERTNNLYWNNGAIFDYQMQGIGIVLEKISESLSTISENQRDYSHSG